MTEEKFMVDFGAVKLSSLVLTNDKEHYERMKTRKDIGVLFEPSLLKSEAMQPIYLIGILEDRADPIPSPKPD
ncbi:hypothetical protein MKY41_11675 [Sporosarcina sp. FSL W7-1349]|uniref:hypothetical protein n=1 Tax=Sporosarcina sp. FSL W7-1349 TaxID=2921561 RepID=UPI0030F6851B